MRQFSHLMKYLLLILSAVHIFAECGGTGKNTTQPERPMESYKVIPTENEISEVNIPVRIDKNEIERQLNTQLSGDFYNDNKADDDGLLVKATKGGNIQVEFSKDEIYYRVPVNLWVQKSLAVTTATARGSINMVFKTAYQLQNNWALQTQTELTGYEWTDKPTLKVGFAKIPVESIANIILERTKNQVTSAIDAQVKNSLNLNQTVNDIWLQLHKPVELSPEYRTWLQPNPQSISLTPLEIDGDTIETNVHVRVRPKISIGAPPATPLASQLPAFQFTNDKNEEFRLNITTEVPFAEAENIALQGLKGESFSQGSRTVTIQDIEIYGQDEKLVVGTETTGAYNGTIYLKGKPEFSEKRNRIELEDVEFDFSSKKFLLNSLSWLFKGKFKTLVQDNLDFQLGYNIEMMKALIAEQLDGYVIAPGVVLNGKLNDLAVQKVYIAEDAIRLTVVLEGNLEVKVGG